jgi:hypothetical protein
MKSIKCFTAMILTVFLFAFFASYASSDGALATITKVKGAPQVIKSGAANAELLKIGETVSYGDIIITDSDSKATLVFNDGEIRIITSGSNVKFSAGDSNEQLTKVDKITSTLAEAVNARNLDNTFVSVTGIKLSMSSGAEKKKASEPMSADAGAMLDQSPKSFPGDSKSDFDGASKENIAFDRIDLPGGAAAEAVAPAPVTAQAPAAPAPPASSLAGSAPQKSVDGGSDLSRPVSTGDAFGGQRQLTTKAVAGRAAHEKKAAEAPSAQWGRWFDDANSLPWNLLMSEDIFDNLEKISFYSAALTQLGPGNFADKLSLTGINDNIVKVTVSFKTKKDAAVDKSFRAQLIIDNERKNKTADELKKIERLKADDMETYLYLKAGIFKQNEFYIAALAALYELEKLQPDVTMKHVLKSKAIIYFKMGEKELSKAASDKLLE